MKTLQKVTTNCPTSLTQDVVADLLKDADIIIYEDSRYVFAELNHGGFHILCERLELDTEYQDITIYYGEIQITDQTTIENVANCLYEYATNELANADSGFSFQDKQHANNLIFS
ncbi:hypothetical protein [Aquimarina sp. 2201CG5-10]|uniref:hypothetical protein n=1 Tax=Aquimarina callyspongiae TaxID=3098150 RepID=UPI002AB3A0CB|nr:hypothetical protein [Aquimarina sp. 2201CG5-10]MDY8137609.1 hypothetical protein [Aquimarina sp. 2201CG5-10]